MDRLSLDVYLVGLRCALPLAMSALPLPTVLRLIDPTNVSTTVARARVAISRSERAGRHLRRFRVPDTCLYRAMVRWSAFRRAGVGATFVLGVRRSAPETGHAWVEVGGVPVDETADPGLVTTFSFPF